MSSEYCSAESAGVEGYWPVTLSIKTLPVVERWDCTGCGKCCRGNVVPLDKDDLQRLRAQRWDEHPDYRRVRTVVRQGLFRPRYRLAQRDDGTCVFLTPDGLCRIHQAHGFDSKPLVCRMYPLQLVPLEHVVCLTLRRSCPAAAADQGRALADHRAEAQRYVAERPRLAQPARPPALTRRCRRSWSDTLVVARALDHVLNDQRYPLVRRLVHGLRFCDLLERCRLTRMDSGKLSELVPLLTNAAPQDVGPLFRDLPQPGAAARVLFRQTVSEYLRLHPSYVVRETWRQRWRLALTAFAFARGRGDVPPLHPAFPRTTFAAVEERPLGALERAVLQPLNAYFETTATSLQYAVVSRPDWPLVDKFRALALAYPVALWMLRYFGGDQPPTPAAVIDQVTAIDRGQGYAPLIGPHHRRRVAHLTTLGALEQLVVWYAQ